jgi:hypothetical protein
VLLPGSTLIASSIWAMALAKVVQPGESRAPKDLGVDIPRILLEELFRPGFGVLELASRKQHLSDLQLNRTVLGHESRRRAGTLDRRS